MVESELLSSILFYCPMYFPLVTVQESAGICNAMIGAMMSIVSMTHYIHCVLHHAQKLEAKNWQVGEKLCNVFDFDGLIL